MVTLLNSGLAILMVSNTHNIPFLLLTELCKLKSTGDLTVVYGTVPLNQWDDATGVGTCAMHLHMGITDWEVLMYSFCIVKCFYRKRRPASFQEKGAG